ncbi:MAG: RnfABCDGE type electron transport complex subunit B [Legionellaceae bacterium]|nr:RnfABCDGE type electron transport complex subunit B [Legionellaceae bacterium]
MVAVKDIDALLPQTQCGECGYPGCMPYAQAMAAGMAELNLCPPGGVKTIVRLGELLQKDVTDHLAIAEQTAKAPLVAKIREEDCIGCTKCITACPVDAIIGTGKHMHTIINVECTGCELCVEPCPVDCIDMVEPDNIMENGLAYDPDLARERFNAKTIRKIQEDELSAKSYLNKRKLSDNNLGKQEDKKAKQDYILQAMERAKKKQSKL